MTLVKSMLMKLDDDLANFNHVDQHLIQIDFFQNQSKKVDRVKMKGPSQTRHINLWSPKKARRPHKEVDFSIGG